MQHLIRFNLTNYRLANIPNTFIKVLCFKQVDDFAPCLKFKNDKTRQDKTRQG